MPNDDPRKRLLAEAWDQAADGYDEYFSPRFFPWIQDAASYITTRPLPPGPILFPCSGPGREMLLIAEALPDRELIGIDLSQGMVALAQARLSGQKARVLQGDAASLSKA